MNLRIAHLRNVHLVGNPVVGKIRIAHLNHNTCCPPVAEFGGALGLFLGFSFMNLWDVVEIAADVVPALLKSLKSFPSDSLSRSFGTE